VTSPGALALLAYVALALAFWGPGLAEHPRSTLLAGSVIDPGAYLWFFAWFPHALLHGQNPLHTDVIFVPDGYNLAWVTSMPGPSLLLAPITLTVGPVATWNLITLAAPALTAWTAFLLCRQVTASVLPSLVGGYIFGFSPYMLGHLIGAPQLLFVAFLPILVLLVVRNVSGSLGERSFVIAMTAALTAQFLTSTEVFGTALFFGGILLAVAYWRLGDSRAQLLRTGRSIGISLAATAALVSPVLFYMLFRPRTLPDHALDPYPADLLSLVVPSNRSAITVHASPLDTPSWASTFAYFGVPLLVLVGLFAWRHGRRYSAQLAVAGFVVAGVACLGSPIEVKGDGTGIPGPWGLVQDLPFIRYAIPARFSVYAFLCAALIVAMWLSWRPSFARWALAGVVVASFLPAVWRDNIWHTRLKEPDFFAVGTYRQFLEPQDRVLTIPSLGPNLWWQAQERFRFQVAGGYVGAFPESYKRYAIWNTLITGQMTADSPSQLRRFVHDKGVTAIVVDKSVPGDWGTLFGSLGKRPVDVGGVLFYRLAGGPVEG
jgi:hypothetical protein